MRTLRLLGLLAFSLSVSPAHAQQVQTITGVVTGPDALPLDSARVEVTSPYAAFDSTDAAGAFEVSGVIPTTPTETGPTDSRFAITDAYPNPFGAAVQVCTTVPADGTLETTLTDLAGRRVAQATERLGAGRHCMTLGGAGLAAGTYLVTQRFDGTVRTRRVTHMPGAPGATGDAAAPTTAARGSGCFDVDLVVTRRGYEPVEATECLPLDAAFDPVLAFAMNSQEIVVMAASGGPLAGATVALDTDGDGEPEATATTGPDGEVAFQRPYYGLAHLTIAKAGYETDARDLFFGSAPVAVELQNLPFAATVVVRGAGIPPPGVPGATVAATCDVNGVPYETEATTDAAGEATLGFAFDDLARGGEYVLDCDLDIARGSYFTARLSVDLVDQGVTDVMLPSRTLHEMHAVDLLHQHQDLSGESIEVVSGSALELGPRARNPDSNH